MKHARMPSALSGPASPAAKIVFFAVNSFRNSSRVFFSMSVRMSSKHSRVSSGW
jgi:hypothetical protein